MNGAYLSVANFWKTENSPVKKEHDLRVRQQAQKYRFGLCNAYFLDGTIQH
jgi:hypothetical protein